MSDNIIEMRGITKRFPGIVANDKIDLVLKKGEIHSLLGENGAGKSTLMSVLFGLYDPEEGCILLNGEEIKIKSPNDANKYHIGMVHQHFKLVDVFTGLQNIVLGFETTNKGGFLKFQEAREKLNYLMDTYSLHVDVDKLVSEMTVGEQQRVEILKMLYKDNEILIFDEPTAVLTPAEIEGLMDIIKRLKSEGKTILFISHKLNEIREISDRVTVLRKGKSVGDFEINEKTNEEFAELMVGRKVNFSIDKKECNLGETVLKLEELTYIDKKTKKEVVNHVSLDVKKGEIVALLGIDGNGQEELVECITGLLPVSSGKVLLNNEDITNFNVKHRNEKGISHIPADRHRYGLVLDYNLMYNIVLDTIDKAPSPTYVEIKKNLKLKLKELKNNKNLSEEEKVAKKNELLNDFDNEVKKLPAFAKGFSRFGFILNKNVRQYSDEMIQKYDIRSSQGSVTLVRSMSGGNQQKVIVAREVDRDCYLLIAVQPTRGLDIGAIEHIHKELLKERDSGHAILLCSLELEEVFNIADRILIIYDGEITGEFNPKETSFKEVGLYMSGAKRNNLGEEDK